MQARARPRLGLDFDERLEPGLAGEVDERGEPVSEDFRHQEDRIAAERPGLRAAAARR